MLVHEEGNNKVPTSLTTEITNSPHNEIRPGVEAGESFWGPSWEILVLVKLLIRPCSNLSLGWSTHYTIGFEIQKLAVIINKKISYNFVLTFDMLKIHNTVALTFRDFAALYKQYTCTRITGR